MPAFDLTNANAFLPFFGVLFLGIPYLLSHLSGWRSLASRFAFRGPVEGEQFRFASAAMGYLRFPVSYSNCLSVTVAPTGLRISIFPLFRPFGAPIFIPRAEIESVTESRFLFMRSTVIRVRGHWGATQMYGSAGAKILRAYSRP